MFSILTGKFAVSIDKKELLIPTTTYTENAEKPEAGCREAAGCPVGRWLLAVQVGHSFRPTKMTGS